MPFCPECKYEYVAGTATCTDCNAELVAELPTDEPVDEPLVLDEATEHDLVNVYSAADPAEAGMVRSVLTCSEIPCFTRAEPDGPVIYRGSYLHPGLIIAVPAELHEEAEEAIRMALEDGKTFGIEQPWDEETEEPEEP